MERPTESEAVREVIANSRAVLNGLSQYVSSFRNVEQSVDKAIAPIIHKLGGER